MSDAEPTVQERRRTGFELVALTFATVIINGWNRLAVSFRTPAGSYQPQAVTA